VENLKKGARAPFAFFFYLEDLIRPIMFLISEEESFPPIFEKYDSEFLLKEIFTNHNSKPIEIFTKELKEKKEKFENQCVPQGYLEIHQEMIGFFSVIENIFETFLDWKNDPLKTLVAIEELKILSERVKNFSQILEEKLKQDGFSL